MPKTQTQTPFDTEATIAALHILTRARVEASDVTAVWKIASHAYDRLNAELAEYLKGERS